MTDLFIIVLLLWLWCWDLPRDLPARRLIGRLRLPFVWLGLWHGWAMFAPEPLHVNRRLKAVITYTDSSVDEWRPLEPQRSGWFLDLLWFRHFKFQFSVLSGSSRCLWNPLCDWLTRQAAADGLQASSIQLVREYQMVRPPGSQPPVSEWRSAVMHKTQLAEPIRNDTRHPSNEFLQPVGTH